MGPIELDLCSFIDKNTDFKTVEHQAKKLGLDWEFDKCFHNYFILNDLYYNLRNLLRIEVKNASEDITAASLCSHQEYIDSIEQKLIM